MSIVWRLYFPFTCVLCIPLSSLPSFQWISYFCRWRCYPFHISTFPSNLSEIAFCFIFLKFSVSLFITWKWQDWYLLEIFSHLCRFNVSHNHDHAPSTATWDIQQLLYFIALIISKKIENRIGQIYIYILLPFLISLFLRDLVDIYVLLTSFIFSLKLRYLRFIWLI